MPGKVYLVGAGPGDPGLLTLRGKALLERADCVLYDFLSSEELLRFAPEGCERIFAGKRAGVHVLSQEEIIRMLVSRARQGLNVVRLKGGDPYVFGRGGEEAEALWRAGIAFEVVPGVSSAIAAPAYAGIPVTHRDCSSGFTVLTGHAMADAEGESAADESARLENNSPDTLVVLMGARRLAAITAQLIEGGRSPATPAAVVRWGSVPSQHVITGTLADIASKAADLQPPAVLVAGQVVTLRERLNWFERLPLFGRRVAITRAADQSTAFHQALRELGAEPVDVPSIAIRPPDSWEPLDSAIARLESFQYLLVTSVNGVSRFVERLKASGRDVRDLKGIEIGAIGPATAAEFARNGVRVDFVPREYRAEGLLQALAGRELGGKAFLIPRAKVARDLVPRVLAEHGAKVEVVEAYQTTLQDYAPGELEARLEPWPSVATFTSSSTVSHFVRLLEARGIRPDWGATVTASIGPITSATMRSLGLPVTVEARESTVPGLLEAVREYFLAKTAAE